MSTAPVPARIPAFTLGDRLRKARELTEMTTRDFAAQIGVSQKTISDAENDRRAPRRITLLAYAMATGVPLEWLETGREEAPRPGRPGGDDGEEGIDYRTVSRFQADPQVQGESRGFDAILVPSAA